MAASRHHLELSGYRVRAARPSDAAALARIHVNSWHYAYRGIIADHNLAHTNYSRAVHRFRAYFASRGLGETSQLHVLDRAAGSGGHAGVIGYVNSGRTERTGLARGEVFELYLDPEFHGLGGGRKLLSAGLWALSGQALLPAVVWVLADNVPARRFYEGMRGHEVARGRVEVGDQVLEKVAYVWSDYLPWPEWIAAP